MDEATRLWLSRASSICDLVAGLLGFPLVCSFIERPLNRFQGWLESVSAKASNRLAEIKFADMAARLIVEDRNGALWTAVAYNWVGVFVPNILALLGLIVVLVTLKQAPLIEALHVAQDVLLALCLLEFGSYCLLRLLLAVRNWYRRHHSTGDVEDKASFSFRLAITLLLMFTAAFLAMPLLQYIILIWVPLRVLRAVNRTLKARGRLVRLVGMTAIPIFVVGKILDFVQSL